MPGIVVALLIAALVWLLTGSLLIALIVFLILGLVGFWGWGYYGSHYGHRRAPP